MTFTNLPSKADDIITVKKSKVILYLGGCKGTTSDGTKAKYYTLAKVRKLMYGFDKNTYDIVLKSDSESVASVDSKKDIIYAEGIGETYVDVTIKRKKTGKTGKKDIVFSTRIKVVVKQNADEDSFFVNGLENGQSFFEGDTVTVSMPGDYTDLRLVESDDEEIIIKALNDGISYNIEFPEVGKYLITAASYQSKKYNGFVVSKEFEITVKERPLEVCQIGSESIRIKGNFSDQEIENDDFTVFEDKDGACYFYSYVSEVAANRDSLDLKLFIPLESEKDYILEYEGLQYKLHSEPCDIKDVYSFEINENVIQTGENTVLTYSYFNKNGLDISKSVSQKLDPMVELKLKDENTFDGFVSGNSIYIIK
jgi:hypothetical protein